MNWGFRVRVRVRVAARRASVQVIAIALGLRFGGKTRRVIYYVRVRAQASRP